MTNPSRAVICEGWATGCTLAEDEPAALVLAAIDAGNLEHFTDWAGKAPGAAARLAGVLHGIKHAHGKPWEAAITAETMNAALEIMAVITRHSLAALDMMGADPTIAAARLVWDWIERGRLARFTMREAFNALCGTFPRVSMLRGAPGGAGGTRLSGSYRAAARRSWPSTFAYGTGEAGDCEGLAMSWRETLGVTPSGGNPYAHNSHNAQRPAEKGNCADSADSAYRNTEEEGSKLLEALADACRGLSITPAEVKKALAPENVEDWRKGEISNDTLAAFARSLLQRREMSQGKRPAHYTEHATCKHCGPIWLWFSSEVLGCPWCWNRAANKPIPRPVSVHCSDCIHFERIEHPHLGHCAKGEPEAIAGLWDSDRRYCERFLPLPRKES